MQDPQPPPLPSLKHAGLGLASFVISVVAAGAMFVVFLVAGVMEVSQPGGLNEKSPVAVIIGLFMLGLIVVDLIGLGLGISGFLQKQRKIVFAVLGTVISAITILGTIALIVIGNMSES
jgi:hypothetical protein